MLCDVVLVAQGSEIHAHKLVLATCSTMFYWQFSNDRNLGQLNRIEIENISFETLSAVVEYLYTSEVFITEKNVLDLLAAAYMLVLKDLQIACHDFLKVNLKPSNCLQYRNIAKLFKCNELIPKLDNYIGVHLFEIASHPEFLELPYNQLIRIISSDELSTREENVLECVFKWVRHDLQTRRDLIYHLIKAIRFSLIPQQYMLQRLEEEQWLTYDPLYNSFLGQVFKCYSLTGNRVSLVTPRLSLESRQCSKLLVVVGTTNDGMQLSIDIYDIQQNNWMRWPKALRIKCEYKNPKVTIIGSSIYYIDGHKFKGLSIHNPAEMERLHCDIMDIAECYSITCHESKIYAAVSSKKSQTVQIKMYDVYNSLTWQTLPDMPEPRSLVSLMSSNESLYAVGGGDKLDWSSTIEFFKPTTNSWYLMPNMSIHRSESSIAVIGNILYVVGGRNSEGACKQLEAFNYDECCWTQLADMNIARSDPGAISINGQLYVIGGYNDNSGCLDSVEVYDPQSNTWTMLMDPMDTAKRYVATALIDISL